ncbi:ankyrin repeat domain-containing protein [Thalassotalea sp. G20_0]|uniref:ankyrin repeat domain-containing protein n=1 Tax=Thalassotalea sp. G20_0 TaxID=2821093 RepID=UPI001AD9EF95|nr:ankyrin repeat domain-containing protein [Thalassotalea sp. G20_0]MBO9493630.1 ankyrin repeat domain-containing protein [Thalassotalea sp. G20_0]
MYIARASTSDHSFKCSICHRHDGGTTNEFAGKLQVKASCQYGCQLHLGCIPQLTDQQLKLGQRSCSECQKLPLLPLLCGSESLEEYACHSGNWQALALMLKIKVDHGVSIHVDKRLLFIAVQERKSKCLELLCMTGANVNAALIDGSTPLHMAAFYGDTDSLKVLLKIPGVNVSALEEDGFTPLHWAATNGNPGHTDCLKLLIAHPGVDINAKDVYGLTPLHWAAAKGNTDSLKLLLDTPRIDIHVTCKLGLTPLHHAAKWARVDCVEALLCKGANVNAAATDRPGTTPLDLARNRSNPACAERLIAKGAKTSLELKALEEEARKEQECRLM